MQVIVRSTLRNMREEKNLVIISDGQIRMGFQERREEKRENEDCRKEGGKERMRKGKKEERKEGGKERRRKGKKEGGKERLGKNIGECFSSIFFFFLFSFSFSIL